MRNLQHATARQLQVLLIIARRESKTGEVSRILREYNRRGIKPGRKP